MARLSIIIPTLNVARPLRRSLPPLAEIEAVGLVREVIFADGGSTDETAEIAEASGARLISAPRGRGTQLAAGAEASRGEWMLFLHADSKLAAGWESGVRGFIDNPENADRAGFFRFGLDDHAAAARWLEALVGLRCGLLKLPFGDQGLLISRSLYNRLGGFRPLPLMEDVDLVRRIGRRRLAPLGCGVETSAIRYRRDGYLLRPLRNICCLTLYFLGVPPRAIEKFYG